MERTFWRAGGPGDSRKKVAEVGMGLVYLGVSKHVLREVLVEWNKTRALNAILGV